MESNVKESLLSTDEKKAKTAVTTEAPSIRANYLAMTFAIRQINRSSLFNLK